MSKSLNQVFLLGNVGKDPEVRSLEGGLKVATFSLATSTGGYKKQDGTEVPEKTQWHSIVCWRGLADIAERFIKKGDRLTVVGTIQYRQYEGNDGVKRYATDILALDLILGGKSETTSTARPAPTAADAPTRDDFPAVPPDADQLPF